MRHIVTIFLTLTLLLQTGEPVLPPAESVRASRRRYT